MVRLPERCGTMITFWISAVVYSMPLTYSLDCFNLPLLSEMSLVQKPAYDGILETETDDTGTLV